MNRDVMTIEQVADYLQISVKSAYKLAKAGEIPARKVLNKWRFHRNSIDEYVFKDTTQNGNVELK